MQALSRHAQVAETPAKPIIRQFHAPRQNQTQGAVKDVVRIQESGFPESLSRCPQRRLRLSACHHRRSGISGRTCAPTSDGSLQEPHPPEPYSQLRLVKRLIEVC